MISGPKRSLLDRSTKLHLDALKTAGCNPKRNIEFLFNTLLSLTYYIAKTNEKIIINKLLYIRWEVMLLSLDFYFEMVLGSERIHQDNKSRLLKGLPT